MRKGEGMTGGGIEVGQEQRLRGEGDVCGEMDGEGKKKREETEK